MGGLCNNNGFRWAAGIVITIAMVAVGWLIANATQSTQVRADVRAVDVRVDTVKEQVQENSKALKNNQQFQRDIVKEVAELRTAQETTQKDVEWIKGGQQRLETLLGKIEQKLPEVKVEK